MSSPVYSSVGLVAIRARLCFNRQAQDKTLRPSQGPPNREAAHAVGLIGLEPALESAGTDAEVCGNMMMASAASGHKNRLAAVTQTPIGGRFEGVLQATPFTGTQGDFDHGCSSLTA
jgi:hypothetical protein